MNCVIITLFGSYKPFQEAEYLKKNATKFVYEFATMVCWFHTKQKKLYSNKLLVGTLFLMLIR